MNRRVVGFEINPAAFAHHAAALEAVEPEPEREVVVRVPENKGKRLFPEDVDAVLKEYKRLMDEPGTKKKDVVERLGERFGRGKFSVVNILRKIHD